MDVQGVADIIHRIAEGFEDACADTLGGNTGFVLSAVKEQLYSGQDGEGKMLTPDYDSDPYFEEEGYWYHRAADYKAWKRRITPPKGGTLLGLPPRPDNVPNLFIDGTFFSEINAKRSGKTIIVEPGNGNGPAIEDKYGDQIMNLGPTAKEYFKENILLPAIKEFFENCGYR